MQDQQAQKDIQELLEKWDHKVLMEILEMQDQ